MLSRAHSVLILLKTLGAALCMNKVYVAIQKGSHKLFALSIVMGKETLVFPEKARCFLHIVKHFKCSLCSHCGV